MSPSDPIQEVSEEIGKLALLDPWPDVAFSWYGRLTSYWTPERAAFMRAAEAFALWRFGSPQAPYNAELSKAFGEAYRAMKESEK